MSGPVIFGMDAITNRVPRTQYGIDSGLPLSNDTLRVINNNFVDYMDNFPLVKGGLWSLVMEMLPPTSNVTVNDLKTRYGVVERQYVK